MIKSTVKETDIPAGSMHGTFICISHAKTGKQGNDAIEAYSEIYWIEMIKVYTCQLIITNIAWKNIWRLYIV